MAMNRVQFQPGLSMHDFMALYGTPLLCEQALIDWRWPQGYRCSSCGSCGHTTFRRRALLYMQCTTCRFQCSPIAGTIFESTKLALTKWFLAMHLLTQAKTNMSMLELSRHIGVSYPTAWLMKHKLMEVMRLRESSRRLTGRVEMDDAYLGGERSGGKRGRGSENKVPFVAAVQTTESGAAQFVCLAQLPFTKQALQTFADHSLVRPLTVVSDGLSCFTVTETTGVHERIITGGGKASVANPKFAAINTTLSNLKTAITGAYHAIGFFKYAHRYLAEFQYRFNRRFDLSVIFKRLVIAVAATSPMNRVFIRMADVGC